MALELTEKRLVTDQIVLDVGYDIENMASYKGEAAADRYGRKIPKAAHGSHNSGARPRPRAFWFPARRSFFRASRIRA